MFEDGHVQRLGKGAADRALADPADMGAEQLDTRYADAQGQVHTRRCKPSDAKSARRKVFESRLRPWPRTLANFADERHSGARDSTCRLADRVTDELLVFHGTTLINRFWITYLYE